MVTKSLNPCVIPLAIGGAYLLEDHCDAYPSALRLFLVSCAAEVLTSLGFGNVIWLLMVPVVVLSTAGPLFTHYGNCLFV